MQLTLPENKWVCFLFAISLFAIIVIIYQVHEQKEINFFNVYISDIPQNEFAFQWIFVIATQFLKVIKEFSMEGRGFFCRVSQHYSYSLEEKGVRHVYRSSN